MLRHMIMSVFRWGGLGGKYTGAYFRHAAIPTALLVHPASFGYACLSPKRTTHPPIAPSQSQQCDSVPCPELCVGMICNVFRTAPPPPSRSDTWKTSSPSLVSPRRRAARRVAFPACPPAEPGQHHYPPRCVLPPLSSVLKQT